MTVSRIPRWVGLETNNRLSFVFRLYKYVAVPFLTEWLSLRQFILLVNSFCKGHERDVLRAWCEEFNDLFLKRLFKDVVSVESFGIFNWMHRHGLSNGNLVFNFNDRTIAKIGDPFGNTETILQLSYVRAICLCDNPKVSHHIKSLLMFLTNLEILRFLSCLEGTMMTIATTCKNISSCIMTCTVDDSQICLLCQNCPLLSVLDLSVCDSIGLRALMSLSIYSKNLKQLIFNDENLDEKCASIFMLHSRASLKLLKWSKLFLTNGVQYFGGSLEVLHFPCNICRNIILQLSICPKLVELHIKSFWSRFSIQRPDVIDDIIVDSVNTLSKLTDLCLPRIKQLSDINVKSILLGCPLLEYLDLDTIMEPPVPSTISLLSNMKKMSVLRLPNFQLTDETFLIICKCNLLSELIVSRSVNISDGSFVSLAENCKRLTVLDVSYTGMGDLGLLALETHCKWLRDLNLEGCKRISMPCVLPLIQLLSFASINVRGTSLNLNNYNELRESFSLYHCLRPKNCKKWGIYV